VSFGHIWNSRNVLFDMRAMIVQGYQEL